MMENELAQTLGAQLEQERLFLIRGDIDSLGEMAEAKRELLDSTPEESDIGAEDLSRLQRQAARNMTMIEAALRGVRSARQRLEDIKRVSHNLDTYSAKGAMKNLGDVPRNVERRA